MILRRAAEMQIANGGSTLAEMERSAAESGLDPAYVRLAAGEMGGISSPMEETSSLGRETAAVAVLYVLCHFGFVLSHYVAPSLMRPSAVLLGLFVVTLGFLAARTALTIRMGLAALVGANMAAFILLWPLAKLFSGRFMNAWFMRERMLGFFTWELMGFAVPFALAYGLQWLIRAHRPRAMG